MRRFFVLLGVASLFAGGWLVAVPAGATTAPMIVKAVMGDKNGNDRADRVTLTYSAPIAHVDDKDGSYPFSVAGYVITDVGAAKNSTTLVITLAERAKPDIEARPQIVYSETTHQPVTGGGKQAAAQTFKQTKPLDLDGDGYTVADGDCAPLNPAIHPGAADLPDLAFVDSNCDGIDGDAAQAIFVAPSGSDANPGTKASPKASIQSAITAAATQVPPFNVYVAAGSYSGTITLASGVGVYGDYNPVTWARPATGATTITGAPAAAADGATGVTLQLLTLHGTTSTSAYGLLATNGAAVTLDDVTIDTDPGATGTSGSPGVNGGTGTAGANATGSAGAGSGAGAGGNGGVGLANGAPGTQGYGTSEDRQGGSGGTGGTAAGPTGGAGGAGAPGPNGTPGFEVQGSFLANGYGPGGGVTGSRGYPGAQGGGGGGGRGQQVCTAKVCTPYSGGGGGGGGDGGTGGSGGGAGSGGGGSIGIYAYSSTITVTSDGVKITTTNGGNGGSGSSGGSGGPGGTGGKGYSPTIGGAGGPGGAGGYGGEGGYGSSGSGGPSIGIFDGGGTSLVGAANAAITIGSGGSGAFNGIAQPIYP